MAIPRETLADAFREHLANRRVKELLFLTFALEPGFFEQEILSTFLDIGSVPNDKVRLAMLEERLRTCPVAVYYDPGALDSATDSGSSRLPIARIPVQPRRGVFHPKNVFALLEDSEVAEDGSPPKQHLLVATMSANATRAGWWSNVEVCHIEVLTEGDRTSFADDLRRLLRSVRQRSVDPRRESHETLEHLRSFLQRLDPISTRTKNGVVQTRVFHSEGESVRDFLADTLAADGRKLNLEVLSPFFDGADATVLRELIAQFSPREVRLLLPRDEQDRARCTKAFFESIAKLETVRWAKLPREVMSSGHSDKATPRTVHAKVYRFFHPARRTEYVLSGSPNLTSAGHSGTANFESAVLVDVQPERVPDWWTELDRRPPREFSPAAEEGSDARSSPLIALTLRYDWITEGAEALWDSTEASPIVTLDLQSGPRELGSLPVRTWTPLGPEVSARLAERLGHTSFVRVRAPECEPTTVMVLEEGMEQKPSVVLELSAAEILKYWALLTPEQRSVFLEDRFAADAVPPAEREQLRRKLAREAASMFDTFAGIFHAFQSLEKQLAGAIEKREWKWVRARLLAEKYDGLPLLLHRLETDLVSGGDPVKAYVIVLCAIQLVRSVRAALVDPPDALLTQLRALQERLQTLRSISNRIDVGGIDGAAFIQWFERSFLARADAPRAA